MYHIYDSNVDSEGSKVSSPWVLRIMEPFKVHTYRVEVFGDYAAE